MTVRLRLCRLDVRQNAAVEAAGTSAFTMFQSLSALLAREAPERTACLFAEPERTPDGKQIDWYSRLPGQPAPLTSLSASERLMALERLRERLDRVRIFADRVAASGDEAMAEALRQIAAEPAPGQVYVQNGEPVIVGWDRPWEVDKTLPRRAAAAQAASAGGGEATRAWWGRWLFGGLALLLLAFVLWRYGAMFPAWLKPKEFAESSPSAGDDTAILREQIRKAETELRQRLDACSLPKEGLPKEVPPKERPKETGPSIPAPVAPESVKPEAKKPEPGRPSPPPLAPANPKPDRPESSKSRSMPAPEPKMSAPKTNADCPPPPKSWEKPEVAILFDASGSMALPASLRTSEVRALLQRAMSGDPAALAQVRANAPGSRLEAAKGAVADLAAKLPPEVDLGLLVFGRCEGTDNYRFFGAGERPQMISQLRGIQPQRGTPLARGLERAGNMLDGVSVSSTIVVVTDGEDSCGGDPCAVARRLQQSKPQLKVNVVSVDGSGEGRCMAEITGGRMILPQDGEPWGELMLRASDQTLRPAGCP